MVSAARAVRKARSFLGRIAHDPRRHGPGRHRGFDQFRQPRNCGDDDVERTGPLRDARERRAEHRRHAADFARAAAGQHEDKRRIGEPALGFLSVRAQPRDLLGERVADKGAGWPAQPAQGLRLERQQREHVVDVRAHGARAAGPPGPNRRADVIDDRDGGCARAHAPRHAMGEFRAVDDHQHIGPGGNHRVGRLANARKDFRQARRDGGKAHDGQFAERERAFHAFGRHMVAADAGKARAAAGRTAQRRDQSRAQAVAQFLARHQEDMRAVRIAGSRRLAHDAVPAASPTTNRPARSARATRSAGSAIMVSSAMTAMPASPARAAPSTVFGPIDGRSKRRS